MTAETNDDSFQQHLSVIDTYCALDRVLKLGFAINNLLTTDRKRGLAVLQERGIAPKTAERLQLVGQGKLDPRIFRCGSYVGSLAEALDIKDQKLLLRGVKVITGGTKDNPVVEVLTFHQLNIHTARLLIDHTVGKLRSVDEQAKKRVLVLERRKERLSAVEKARP